jgi:hypothetical protein
MSHRNGYKNFYQKYSPKLKGGISMRGFGKRASQVVEADNIKRDNSNPKMKSGTDLRIKGK